MFFFFWRIYVFLSETGVLQVTLIWQPRMSIQIYDHSNNKFKNQIYQFLSHSNFEVLAEPLDGVLLLGFVSYLNVNSARRTIDNRCVY